MTPMISEPIRDASAWRGAAFKSRSDIAYDLTPGNLAAIDELMSAIKAEGLAMEEIDRARFSHPGLDGDLARVYDELRDGRGLVLVRGFPVDRYSDDEIAMIYWGIGSHFGSAVSQSAKGDRLGHVVDATDNGRKPNARGYLSPRELLLHTDPADIVGLMCLRPARSGGESIFASASTIHNEIASRAPKALEVLYRGFPYHRRGEQAPDAPEITPYNVPTFSTKDGALSVFYVREIVAATYHDLGRDFTAEEREALDLFDEIGFEDDIRLELKMAPGEAAFFNNNIVLHARNEFVDFDEPEKKRHLLRLWLQSHQRRPHVKEINIYENEDGRPGIDPQEGRGPAEGKYLAEFESPRLGREARVTLD